jgi:Tol biopolymer transport system component
MRRSVLIFSLFVAVLAAVGAVPQAGAACPSRASSAQCALARAAILLPSAWRETSTGAGRIAFSLFRAPTRADIYTINSRGGDIRRLTNGPGMEAFPAWSPDGTRIAFDWDGRGAASGIYVMNPDGSGQRLLANGDWGTPAWSPDGSKIAFQKVGRGDEQDIYVVERDGSGLHLLRRQGWSPSWSPDGTKIAYTENDRIYVMNSDGTGERLLAHGDFPAWSPDGKTIAFHNTRYFVNHTNPVWIMSTDGSDKRPLYVRAWEDCALAWSPGGELAVANPSGLFFVRLLGHVVTKVSGAHICGVTWQPAGRSAPG